MTHRREVLALLAASVVLGAGRSQAAPKSVLPLWPGSPPGGGGPSGEPDVSPKGALRNIAVPSIEILRPPRPNGSAVLVSAGGGYKRIEIGKEARPAAEWLIRRGITACILRYRLPSEGWAAGPLAPLQDAQRALRLMRVGAVPDVDPTRIGALGFSAGGHLMGLAATMAAAATYDSLDAADRQSARPDGAALAYPVITLLPPYDDTSTRRSLVGRHPSAAQSAEWSVETHVDANCPPIFLVQALDDPVADPQNSSIMAEACCKAGVPVELHQFGKAGHGFGMGRPGSESAQWPDWYETWLRQRGFLS